MFAILLWNLENTPVLFFFWQAAEVLILVIS